jgi:serine/threonine-protein kinase HipA
MRLSVWLDGIDQPIGRLESFDSGAISFSYHEDYLNGAAIPISLSLPPQSIPFSDAQARAFFSNLLPENDQARRLIEREGLSRDDVVGILYHLGADCSGAISCLPEGAAPVKMPGDLAADYEALSDDDIAAIMTSLRDFQRLPNETADPSPLAGVQGKIALTVLPDGRWALPKPDRKVPSTHILKVPERADQGDVRHEWAACSLMHGLGMWASVPQMVERAGVQGLLINRFDRIVSGNTVIRLHQEDFAQALGLPPRLKYERNGQTGRTFDAAAVAGLIDRLRIPAQAKRTFLLATIINLALGNNDNHAKNHALLYMGSAVPQIAPLYDVLPVRLNDRYTDRLAFNIGRAERFEDITHDDIKAFFATFGLDGGRYRRFIDIDIKPRFQRLDEFAMQIQAQGMKSFDDLIGNNLMRLNDLMGLDLQLRERDLFVAQGGGWIAS